MWMLNVKMLRAVEESTPPLSGGKHAKCLLIMRGLGPSPFIELVGSRGNLLGSRLINVDVKSTRNIEIGFTPFDYCRC